MVSVGEFANAKFSPRLSAISDGKKIISALETVHFSCPEENQGLGWATYLDIKGRIHDLVRPGRQTDKEIARKYLHYWSIFLLATPMQGQSSIIALDS